MQTWLDCISSTNYVRSERFAPQTAAVAARAYRYYLTEAGRSGNAFDDPEVEQPAQLSRQSGWRDHAEVRQQVAPANAGDVDPRVCKACNSALSTPPNRYRARSCQLTATCNETDTGAPPPLPVRRMDDLLSNRSHIGAREENQDG